MRDHAQEAVDMLGDRGVEQLRTNRMLQLALLQLIEIVGEAAARVPADVRQIYPSVPWQLAAGMRNRLIHGYDVVEFEIVYDTVKDDLPALVAQLDAILQPPTA
jgi:uncharacterized protein with HEPN domain